MEIPYNPLHERGFISIGCEPCTRPVLPNQHEREGRWWWEEATHKECGLHAGNLKIIKSNHCKIQWFFRRIDTHKISFFLN